LIRRGRSNASSVHGIYLYCEQKGNALYKDFTAVGSPPWRASFKGGATETPATTHHPVHSQL
jgi:hypothetical protein